MYILNVSSFKTRGQWAHHKRHGLYIKKLGYEVRVRGVEDSEVSGSIVKHTETYE